MFRKSQAALEFLTTYGWAFLLIMIMISALAYFGVLDPHKLLPGRCNFGSEFSCIDYAIDATNDEFKLRLKNNVGEAIIIPDVETDTGIDLSSETSTEYDCELDEIDGDSTLPTDYTWATGDLVDFTFTDCNSAAAGFKKGGKAKVFVTITYYLAKSTSEYTHQVKGEIVANAG